MPFISFKAIKLYGDNARPTLIYAKKNAKKETFEMDPAHQLRWILPCLPFQYRLQSFSIHLRHYDVVISEMQAPLWWNHGNRQFTRPNRERYSNAVRLARPLGAYSESMHRCDIAAPADHSVFVDIVCILPQLIQSLAMNTIKNFRRFACEMAVRKFQGLMLHWMLIIQVG